MAERRQFQALFPGSIVSRQTVDPAAFVDNESQLISLTIPGAAIGDVVLVAPGVDVTECTFSASVTAANTVGLVLSMTGGDTNNLASSTWTFVVLKVKAE